MFKKNKPRLQVLSSLKNPDDKKNISVDLRDADPNYVIAKYEKLRRQGDDIPIAMLMFMGDLHRKLEKTEEAVRMYGEACRKAIDSENWTIATQLLKRTYKAIPDPTPGMLQLSLQIALGQGMNTEAISTIEKLGKKLNPRQMAEIEAVIGIIDREASVDSEVEMALATFLVALYRPDRAAERLTRVAQRARRAGQPDLAARYEAKLKESGWAPEAEVKSKNAYAGATNFELNEVAARAMPQTVNMRPTAGLPMEGPGGRVVVYGHKKPQDKQDSYNLSEVEEAERGFGNSKEAGRKPILPPLILVTPRENEGRENKKYDPQDDNYDAERNKAGNDSGIPALPVLIMPAPKPPEEKNEKAPARTPFILALPPMTAAAGAQGDRSEKHEKPEGPKPPAGAAAKPVEMPKWPTPAKLPAITPFSFPVRPLPGGVPTGSGTRAQEPIKKPVLEVPEAQKVQKTQKEVQGLEDFFKMSEPTSASDEGLEGQEDVSVLLPRDQVEEDGGRGEEQVEGDDASEDAMGRGEENDSVNNNKNSSDEGEGMLLATDMPEPEDLIGIEDYEDEAEMDKPLPPAPSMPETNYREKEAGSGGAKSGDWFGSKSRDNDNKATSIIADELADLPVSDRDQVKALAGALMSGLRATIDPEDAQSHYDLGTAFLQMKLYQEASEAFQLAFRSPEFRVKAVEGLARSFMEQNSAGLAYRVVKLVLPELPKGPGQIGAIYWLARAAESLGRVGEAKDLYAEISIQDITFADAAERMRDLEKR